MSESMDTVTAAAAWLDTLAMGKVTWLSPDWRSKIDIDSLNMSSTKKCILGQLQGDYDDAIIDLRRVDRSGWSTHSFTFGVYTADWKEYLEKSRTPKFENGSLWYSKTDSAARPRKIVGTIENGDKKYVATICRDTDSPYLWIQEEFLQKFTLKPRHDFKKGDVLTNSDHDVLFIYVSDDKLYRIGAKDGDYPLGHSNLTWYEEKYGKLSKNGSTFAQKFSDLL